jgi:protein-L-isoaspartate O-methyltransferase
MAAKRTASERFRRRLVNHLSARRVIASDAVKDAFLAVPRELFIP